MVIYRICKYRIFRKCSKVFTNGIYIRQYKRNVSDGKYYTKYKLERDRGSDVLNRSGKVSGGI